LNVRPVEAGSARGRTQRGRCGGPFTAPSPALTAWRSKVSGPRSSARSRCVRTSQMPARLSIVRVGGARRCRRDWRKGFCRGPIDLLGAWRNRDVDSYPRRRTGLRGCRR
jgi:hypothetical protein